MKQRLHLAFGYAGITFSCLGLFLLLGCSDKASEAHCDQAYDHLIEVRTIGEPPIVKKIQGNEIDQKRLAFLKACVGRTSKSVIYCWMDAETTAEMRTCEVRP